MKSKQNKTEFDDKLFYQVIIKSLENLLIFPTKNTTAKLKKTDRTLKVIHTKGFSVLAAAQGTVQINDNTIYITHENGISTVYKNITPTVNNGVKIKQGEEIGQAIQYFELKIEINPAFFINNTT